MEIVIWDKMEEEKILGMCCVCKKIKIDDESDLWLGREDNPVLYDRFLDRFKERISHGYCPEDFKKAMKDVEEFKKNKSI